jgi:ribonuclease P protein component
MLFIPASNDASRFGITVSRRVGNAVVRNRVKRWLREVIRHHWRSLEGEWDVVIIARPKAAEAGLVRLESDFLGFTEWLSRRAR